MKRIRTLIPLPSICPNSRLGMLCALMLLLEGVFHVPLLAEQTESDALILMCYNTENLFDTINDPLHADDDFTPDGLYHWGTGRYYTKLHHIAQVVSSISGWETPAAVGLLEVETDSCLFDLCRMMRKFPYRPLLYEGPDIRGIDVGLLYDTTRLHLMESRPIAVPLPADERPTRDILYCHFQELHIMVCHLPSQLGGSKQTEYKREAARNVIRQLADSILCEDSTALIVAMGDFNSKPLPSIGQLTKLPTPPTHKYQGEWMALDQFYLSPTALQRKSQSGVYAPDWLLETDSRYGEARPKRTYIGPRYHHGYSDHLPIYLHLR